MASGPLGPPSPDGPLDPRSVRRDRACGTRHPTSGPAETRRAPAERTKPSLPWVIRTPRRHRALSPSELWRARRRYAYRPKVRTDRARDPAGSEIDRGLGAKNARKRRGALFRGRHDEHGPRRARRFARRGGTRCLALAGTLGRAVPAWTGRAHGKLRAPRDPVTADVPKDLETRAGAFSGRAPGSCRRHQTIGDDREVLPEPRTPPRPRRSASRDKAVRR